MRGNVGLFFSSIFFNSIFWGGGREGCPGDDFFPLLKKALVWMGVGGEGEGGCGGGLGFVCV